jgi:predicted O-methyltransferase YrrM
MADSLSNAWQVARRLGARETIRLLWSRFSRLPSLRKEVRRIVATRDLEAATRLVLERPFGPGQSIFAMQRPEEIRPFLDLVRAERPRTVVEIGTAAGGTLLLLCMAAAEDATVVSIDLPGGRFGGGFAEWRVPLYRSFALPTQRLHFLRSSSHDPQTLAELSRILPGTIDLLFIDGDHSLRGVEADYQAYSQLVRPGGMIAFHDIQPDDRQPDLQVFVLWNRLRRGGNFLGEFISQPPQRCGFGIGVIRRSV